MNPPNPHQQYLFDHYQDLAEKLLNKKISPEQFAKEQTELHLKLEELADHDGLAKNFLNNQGFAKALERALKLNQRIKIPASLLALDIDHLKKFNDSMGHIAGDKLIKLYASVIEKETRTSDLKGRVGGDEFTVFLANTNVDGAKVVAERIRAQIIKKVAALFHNLSWQQTISIGIAEAKRDDTAQTLRQRADQALYQAKEERDRVVIFKDEENNTKIKSRSFGWFNLSLKKYSLPHLFKL